MIPDGGPPLAEAFVIMQIGNPDMERAYAEATEPAITTRGSRI